MKASHPAVCQHWKELSNDPPTASKDRRFIEIQYGSWNGSVLSPMEDEGAVRPVCACGAAMRRRGVGQKAVIASPTSEEEWHPPHRQIEQLCTIDTFATVCQFERA